MSQISCTIPFATGYPDNNYVTIDLSPIHIPMQGEEIFFSAKGTEISTTVERVKHFFVSGDCYIRIFTEPHLISSSEISELVDKLSEVYHVHDSQIPSE